eukprot:CAMPEP_0117036728 /NCGR_PEP_ID=MMETSP0472-20121206/25989_1 /TAXON_ID=693140 ORGANISM="Tiarina fusus, Strain LIS" /NCGR_SAMPLE_ID=MMETSP0472 /ASSEMBLY_ACC=CAM_ASM_000603 /LENGTH=86 /DNA_ID=CAMNT_0004746549 /DNA_START=163 /DNA_END=419 /DNA_ORIENTATION=+
MGAAADSKRKCGHHASDSDALCNDAGSHRLLALCGVALQKGEETRAKHNASCRASRRDEEVGDVVFRPVFDGVHGLFGWCAEALCG